MAKEQVDYSRLVFTPLEASNATEKYVHQIQGGTEDGMPLYIPKMEYNPEKRKGFLPVKRGELIAVLGRPGNGKCLGKGTKVVMFDGTTKAVDDVFVGDYLMGIDSTPRMVTSLARGVENMYWIRQNFGIDYRVNESHILSLKRSKNEKNKKHGEILNISVRDCVQKGESWLGRWKGWKVGVEFSYKNVPIEPYFLGLWLGDGASKHAGIYTTDAEVIDYLNEYAYRRGAHVSVGDVKRACQVFTITVGEGGRGNDRSVQSALNKMGLLRNKHIPDSYMHNSREVRMALLAGLIDSDGHLDQHGKYEITITNKRLAYQIKSLCDSLGLRTGKGVRTKIAKSQNGFIGLAYRISINGDMRDCPIRVERKKPVEYHVDSTMTGIKIEPDGVGEYYGFTLDGDGLFLLEDYTVTHNTGFMFRWARMRANDLREKARQGDPIAANSVVLYFTMEQMVEELRLFHVAAEQGISATDIANGKLSEDVWVQVTNSLRGMHTTPLWLAGKSLERRKSKIRLTEDALRGTLESIEKWRGDELEVQVDSVYVDYLQRFRSNGQDWVQFYGETYNGLKEMAGDYATRMIVGVQARREVDNREVPIPQMDDGQWSSGIEQQSDGMLSVVRPSHYKSQGETFDDLTVTGHDQMLVTALKRKLGPENFNDWVKFSPEYNKLDEAELKYHKFNSNDI